MRGVWGVLSKVGAIALVFGGTVRAVDNFRLHDSFFTVVVDSTLDSRVNDYVKPIGISKARLKGHDKDIKTLRSLSQMWLDEKQSGRISQIYPGYYGESLIEGPKGDIFSTCTQLSNKLSECADLEIAKGDRNGLSDAVLAIEMINIVRYGSYETLFTSNAYLRRPTTLLKAHWDKVPTELRQRLAKAQDPDERVYRTHLLEQVANHQKVQYSIRYGKEMTREDDNSYTAFLKRKDNSVAAEHFFGFDREIGFSGSKQ
jgi:hypothetical protein